MITALGYTPTPQLQTPSPSPLLHPISNPWVEMRHSVISFVHVFGSDEILKKKKQQLEVFTAKSGKRATSATTAKYGVLYISSLRYAGTT